MNGESPLDYLMERLESRAVRDGDGNIVGIFTKFPKMKSLNLNSTLPNHTHPAFIIHGVEQDAIWLGKYLCAKVGDRLLSLPNTPPYCRISGDQSGDLTLIRSAGTGITGMTLADYGFLKLYAQKLGWKPEGNTECGSSITGTARVWKPGESVALNAQKVYMGVLYRCIKAHTSSADLLPPNTPANWERMYRVGGIASDAPYVPSWSAKMCTISGTGPMSWNMGNRPEGLTDLVGNCAERVYGVRLVDGEIQIIPDNDAADPNTDVSDSSPLWKAIRPSTSSEFNWTLVNPGTSGTVRYNYYSSTLYIDTSSNTSAGRQKKSFSTLTARSTMSHPPLLLQELGLMRTGADDTLSGGGAVSVPFAAGTQYLYRGGSGLTLSDAGLSCLNWAESDYVGYRPRYLPQEESNA